MPEAYNEILSERVNFPPDREQTGREGAAESQERVSQQGGEGEIYCDYSGEESNGNKNRKNMDYLGG